MIIPSMYAVAVSVCTRKKKSVTRVKLSDNLSRDVWPRLKEYMLDHNPEQTKYVIMQLLQDCLNASAYTSDQKWLENNECETQRFYTHHRVIFSLSTLT